MRGLASERRKRASPGVTPSLDALVAPRSSDGAVWFPSSSARGDSPAQDSSTGSNGGEPGRLSVVEVMDLTGFTSASTVSDDNCLDYVPADILDSVALDVLDSEALGMGPQLRIRH